MSTNEPPYSRSEVDLKMENLFQRFEADANRREERFMEEFRKIDATFRLIDLDLKSVKVQIADLRGIVTATGIGLLFILLGFIFPIAWTLWTKLVHWP